ncbi:Rid family detoxifying hydrolase [Metallibacterium scheffleri]|uniref:Reactive intermediate/imine deaminase n=1 Tax=Metallibacterium scheffleri TaxID=993689 RepID=A0A4S3KPC9_9GAMM|nr:Rid family detoxifying hydrolase [Metallibacterium scheffleri]THD10847.1 reactive intermediate/imine deaminase [Metallibacterium scheffleri]
MKRSIISSTEAPAAIGPYSQAVRVADTVYLSGQIALDPRNGQMVAGDISAQARQVFANLAAVADAAGGSLQQAVRIGIFLTDLNDFAVVNQVMEAVLQPPYPARATVGVAALPRGARVEADAILVLG